MIKLVDHSKTDRRGQIPDRVPIDERPRVVDAKERIGDVADLYFSQSSFQARATAVGVLNQILSELENIY